MQRLVRRSLTEGESQPEHACHREPCRKVMLALVIGLSIVLATGCDRTSNQQPSGVETVSISVPEWHSISGKRIVFAHQSVGQNILDGLQSEAAAANFALPIEELSSQPTASGIAHFKVGNNGDPTSKIRDFTSVMDSGLGNGADVAIMKFCYLDVQSHTDVRRLANEYIDALQTLQQRYPETTFVAVTVPLTALQAGPKAWLKRAMGRHPSGYEENLQRLQFNSILRSELKGEIALFDLAQVESSGNQPTEFGGQLLETLNPGFTDDGGHLNTVGASYVAIHFAKFLAKLPDRP